MPAVSRLLPAQYNNRSVGHKLPQKNGSWQKSLVKEPSIPRLLGASLSTYGLISPALWQDGARRLSLPQLLLFSMQLSRHKRPMVVSLLVPCSSVSR